jgi:predicted AAA+ superfamily ATPase
MIRRYLQGPILEGLKHFPVLLVTGARQVGKSTLVQSLIGPSWKARYLTLDDRAVLDAALRDPDGLISATEPPVVIDEVQKAPDLLRAIKRVVDRDRKPGQYLLTGSANIMTLSSVSETLAGRVALHTLYPFSWPEILGKKPSTILKSLFETEDIRQILKDFPRSPVKEYRKEIIKIILSGGYPIPALMDSLPARGQWFDSYRQTYLERDLLQIKAIENIPDFNRLLSLAAFRTGGLMNLSDLSRESGLPFSTLRRYMNLLEVTYQIILLRPYYANIGKRLVKTPKLYFSDTGMASYLWGADHWSALERQGKVGAMVETWVFSELTRLMAVSGLRLQIFFWRTQAGSEVDFMLEHGGRLIALEVKWSHRIDESDIIPLQRCTDALKEKLRFSIILYGGTETLFLTPKIAAVPFSVFFGIA